MGLGGCVMAELDVAISDAEMDARISFLHDLQVMEADFSDFAFGSSEITNRFYDRLERGIRETGEDKWFFLVNLNGTRIDSSAWTAYSRRGRALNLAHSMGSVRFDASEETARQIERAANTEAFDPNLFTSREDALARIDALPSTRTRKVKLAAHYTEADYARRISFDPELTVMDADFSGFTFHHSRDVNEFYDHIEKRIMETDQKWFFAVNMNECQIMPEAWITYAARGKRLNIAASLGSVRFAAGAATETDIRLRAESQGFRPNIRNTREEALALIAELKAELLQGGTLS